MHLSIRELTRTLAFTEATALVSLHNLIPFQHWSAKQLLADGDETRTYRSKWNISCTATCSNEIVGLCLAFFQEYKPSDKLFLYLHRIVVDPTLRRRGIGRSLIASAVQRAMRENSFDAVYVQTPIDPCGPIAFYRRLGFRAAGFKRYEARTDWILKANPHVLSSSVANGSGAQLFDRG